MSQTDGQIDGQTDGIAVANTAFCITSNMAMLYRNYPLLNHKMYNYADQLSNNFLHSRLIICGCKWI